LKKDVKSKCEHIVKALAITAGLLLFSSLSLSAILKTSMGQIQHTSKFLGYQDIVHGFKVEYPADWEKIQFSQGITEGPHNLVVNFLSSSRGPSETFREYLMIETANVTSTSTFSQREISFLSQSFPHFTPVQISNGSLAGHNAYAVVFTYMDPIVGTGKVMQIWTIKGSKAYILSYHTDSANYIRYLPIIETMIKSFELTPK
jgi:eukaryotic-like serine/threonine-protein kinase